MDRGTLKNAQALALFSNLAEKDVDYFRQNYPKFVPDVWWTHESYDTLVWKLWQQLLRESWGKLSADRIIALLTLWSNTFESTESAESEVPGVYIPIAYPYQHAVMFLAVEQWRAKFCENCGQRFIKEKPPQRFCSDACFKESRRAYKRTQWAEHGPDWLKNRKKSKKPKTPRR